MIDYTPIARQTEESTVSAGIFKDIVMRVFKKPRNFREIRYSIHTWHYNSLLCAFHHG